MSVRILCVYIFPEERKKGHNSIRTFLKATALIKVKYYMLWPVGITPSLRAQSIKPISLVKLDEASNTLTNHIAIKVSIIKKQMD